jgi:hypothetical protein
MFFGHHTRTSHIRSMDDRRTCEYKTRPRDSSKIIKKNKIHPHYRGSPLDCNKSVLTMRLNICTAGRGRWTMEGKDTARVGGPSSGRPPCVEFFRDRKVTALQQQSDLSGNTTTPSRGVI